MRMVRYAGRIQSVRQAVCVVFPVRGLRCFFSEHVLVNGVKYSLFCSEYFREGPERSKWSPGQSKIWGPHSTPKATKICEYIESMLKKSEFLSNEYLLKAKHTK
jgi:hypothetical protein